MVCYSGELFTVDKDIRRTIRASAAKMRALTMACGMKEIRLGGGRRRPVQGYEDTYDHHGLVKDLKVQNMDFSATWSTKNIAILVLSRTLQDLYTTLRNIHVFCGKMRVKNHLMLYTVSFPQNFPYNFEL
ncbi:hypothetical protein RRG08_023618 [Elysia crispata]|uniref:Uncharacterized protein n=1 Tax=Elysia crispata TaxID=231223 RepID=A0AAE0XTQ8_9GAST|nr:hypothetical protein RRG08_023618 [Elysia crispata]